MLKTDFHICVAVTVTALCKSPAADWTGVRLGSNVRAHMVNRVAPLGEGFGADAAPQLLVHPSSILIFSLHFFEPLSFGDLGGD